MCLCNKKYIYNSDYKNVINVKNKYTKCEYCKNKYKFYLIYNLKSRFFWVNMIEKDLKKINNKTIKYRKQFTI